DFGVAASIIVLVKVRRVAQRVVDARHLAVHFLHETGEVHEVVYRGNETRDKRLKRYQRAERELSFDDTLCAEQQYGGMRNGNGEWWNDKEQRRGARQRLLCAEIACEVAGPPCEEVRLHRRRLQRLDGRQASHE